MTTPTDKIIADAKGLIMDGFSRYLDDVLPKVVDRAYQAGAKDYAALIQRAIHATPIGILAPHVAPRSLIDGAVAVDEAPSAAGTPGKDGRVARGAVREAVVAVLLKHPAGLPLSAIKVAAKEIDPAISDGGISNELTRNTVTRYQNTGGVWRMQDEYYAKKSIGDGASQTGKDEATEP